MKLPEGRTYTTAIVVGLIFIPALLALVIGIASSIGGGSGPSENGAQAAQAIDPTTTQNQELLQTLRSYTDPATFLKDTSSLDALRTSLNDLINGITSKDAAYANLPNQQQILEVAQRLLATITTIQTNPTGTAAQLAGQSLVTDAQNLQNLIGITSNNLPADKGVCPFCTQKWLPEDAPNINHSYGAPKAIILHYMATTGNGNLLSLDGGYTFFRNQVLGSGSAYVQFIVGQNGTIYQLMHETKQVGGARSYNTLIGSDGKPGISISIENEGQFEDGKPGHNYTAAQLAANVKLVKYLMTKYSIPVSEVISHHVADCRALKLGRTTDIHRSDPGTAFMDAVLKQIGGNVTTEEAECAGLK